jgi:ABC-type molybdate transport system ATPase subunit
MDVTESTDQLIRLVDELVVARNARIRAEDHLTVLRARETAAAKKVERQREKMTVPDATMPECRV